MTDPTAPLPDEPDIPGTAALRGITEDDVRNLIEAEVLVPLDHPTAPLPDEERAAPLDVERLARALAYGVDRQLGPGSAIAFDVAIGAAVVEYARLAPATGEGAET